MNTGDDHLVLTEISKQFGNLRAVNGVSLTIKRGECLALLGPSGCGKTTMLRMIAGLEQPDSGKLHLAGRDITRLSPEARNIGLVFQNYALFPHLTVAENVGYGLAARGKNSQYINDKVVAALGLVQLENLGTRRIHQLSGGQQQRVAIARALAIEPEVLLLDEPLSNLDVALRAQTGRQLRDLIKRLQITTIFVTHDQEDAFALADRVALINSGQLQQMASAAEIYFNPANIFAAQFIGRSNLLKARLQKQLDTQFSEYLVGDRLQLRAPTASGQSEVTLRIRPEAIEFLNENHSSNETNHITARILSQRFAGATIHYYLEAAGVQIEALALTPIDRTSLSVGEVCQIRIPAAAITIFSQ